MFIVFVQILLIILGLLAGVFLLSALAARGAAWGMRRIVGPPGGVERRKGGVLF